MSNDEPAVDTDVLVVGSGPGGAGAALFLATYGTPTLVITKYGQLSDTPRAHITNQRTMETLRDMGLEQRLMREATPWEYMGNTTFCTSLAGDELGRIPSWGTDTRRHADYELQSPCTMLDAPQTITEPVMMQAAQARGAKVRFDTEYLSHTQDESGRDHPGPRPADRRDVRDPLEVPGRRGRRAQQGGGRPRTCPSRARARSAARCTSSSRPT